MLEEAYMHVIVQGGELLVKQGLSALNKGLAEDPKYGSDSVRWVSARPISFLKLSEQRAASRKTLTSDVGFIRQKLSVCLE